MRAFIAIDVDRKLWQKINNVIESIKECNGNIKFTKLENLHFTINFLGEIESEKQGEIAQQINECTKGINPFNVTIKGLGYFGGKRFIRVIWLSAVSNELIALMKKINNAIKTGKRVDKPHITLGRVKSGKNIGCIIDKIEKMKDVKIGEMHITNVKLKKSILTKEGPIYEDIKVFKLKNE